MEDKKAVPVLPSRMAADMESNGHPSGRSKPMAHSPNMERLTAAVTTILEVTAAHAAAALLLFGGITPWCVLLVLQELGEDPQREGLQKTPSRVAKALVAMTKGYWKTKDDVLNDALFKESGSGMVVVRDIEFCSLCEHHLLPFTGKVLPCCLQWPPTRRALSRFCLAVAPCGRFTLATFPLTPWWDCPSLLGLLTCLLSGCR